MAGVRFFGLVSFKGLAVGVVSNRFCAGIGPKFSPRNVVFVVERSEAGGFAEVERPEHALRLPRRTFSLRRIRPGSTWPGLRSFSTPF